MTVDTSHHKGSSTSIIKKGAVGYFRAKYSSEKNVCECGRPFYLGLPFGHFLGLWAFVLLVSDFERKNKQ